MNWVSLHVTSAFFLKITALTELPAQPESTFTMFTLLFFCEIAGSAKKKSVEKIKEKSRKHMKKFSLKLKAFHLLPNFF